MAPDYSGNTKGLAPEATWEFIITYILTFACIVLFAIPFKIHFAHILQNLHQLHQPLNQSFNDQLNSIQILEQLAPLQLPKDHLPGDIIDILERLGKANNIPHNQLYYIVENCTNHYYSKVIETFVLLLK